MYQISIDENISRIAKTSKLTKTLRPTFGLDKHIDRNMTLSRLLEIKRDLKSQIEEYEPRAENLIIDIMPNVNNMIEIRVAYKIKDDALRNEVRIEI